MNPPEAFPGLPERELFLRALEQPTPEERAAFLDDACGINSPLRHRVDLLLQRFGEIGSFLEQPLANDWRVDPGAKSIPRNGPGPAADHRLRAGPNRWAAEPDQAAKLVASTPLPVGGSPPPPISLPRFSDYKLIEEIARGGMGVVYKARQESLNRIVAVKMILAGQFASNEIAQRFKSEARAAAVLHHPNIVAVHEVGVHQGQHFFSMDYVQGQNLAQLVGNRPLVPTQAARYVQLIAEAIHYAHQQGILHRDLKPSNVLIDATTDQPRVTDFGLAKRLNEEASFTLTGQVLGSPNFMPPEQASGSRGRVGKPSDVYGLGGILFYGLTARAPFQGATLETTLQEVLNTEPISPRALNPSAPRDLETICLKCLEKEPSRRYQTAQELAEELGRFLKHEPILARPVSRMEWAWRWCRRKPLVAGLGGTSLLLLLAVAIGSPIAALRIKEQAAVLRRHLYVAGINNASAALQRQQFGRARELLKPYQLNGPFQEDLRGLEWRFLWEQSRTDHELSLEGHSGEVDCAVVSPDGTWLATAGRDRTVQVWDLKSGQEIRTLGGFDDFIDLKAVAFSPDSQLLVAKGGERLRGWRVRDGHELGLPIRVQPNWNVNNAVAFSKDGLTLATRMPGGVGFVETRQWRTNGVFLEDLNQRNNTLSLGTVLVYSPDGRFLVVSDEHELVVRDAQSPQRVVQSLVRKDQNQEMRVIAVAISQEYLAAGFRDGVIALWDLNGWHEIYSFEAQPGFVYDLAFSPDATLLASCGDEHAIQVWSLAKLLQSAAAGKPPPGPSLLRGHTRHVNSVMFVPDGRKLVSSSADGTVKVWELSFPGSQPTLPASERPIWFSPDGRQLIGTDTHSQVRRWDTTKCLDLGQAGPGLIADQALAVSPDGELVVVAPKPGQLEVRDFRTGQILRKHANAGSIFKSARFSAAIGQRRLAFATAHGGTVSYWFWELDSEQKPVLVGIGSGITPDAPLPVFCWSRDGETLVVANVNSGILLCTMAIQHSRTFPTGTEDMISLASSWDGAILAAGGERNYRVRLWEIQSGHELDPIEVPDSAVAAAEFSPDGKTLITCSLNGDVRFWNMALRQELMAVPNHNYMRYFLLFSPDGSSLALPGPRTWSRQGDVSVWHVPALQEIDQEEAKREKLLVNQATWPGSRFRNR